MRRDEQSDKNHDDEVYKENINDGVPSDITFTTQIRKYSLC
jgi:hypothetical protein